MSEGVRFAIPERLAQAPVRLTLLINRKLYEEAEQVAKILGKGTIQNLITSLLEEIIEELKAEGFEIKPFWEEVRQK